MIYDIRMDGWIISKRWIFVLFILAWIGYLPPYLGYRAREASAVAKFFVIVFAFVLGYFSVLISRVGLLQLE